MAGAFYSTDTPESCWEEWKKILIPFALGREFRDIEDFHQQMEPLSLSPFTRAGLENALWHLQAQKDGKPLFQLLGSEGRPVPSGLAVGMYDSVPELLKAIERYLSHGYQRLKIKIAPGWDIEPVRAVQRAFPDIPLMVDANAAYTLRDVEIFQRLDDFDLLMIEQPLAKDDLEGHAQLQRQIRIPICLDESIDSLDSLEQAARLGSCRIVNIKIQRLGGLLPALRVHHRCQELGLPVWCGTMPELGLGQAFGLHLATLPNFQYPSDIHPSLRFFQDDIVEPLIEIDRQGWISIPQGVALGFRVVDSKLQKYLFAQTEGTC